MKYFTFKFMTCEHAKSLSFFAIAKKFAFQEKVSFSVLTIDAILI